MTPDPIGLDGGINLWAYVANNPVNLIDPLGLWGFGIIGSESTEVGIFIIGAGQTGSIGGGAGIFITNAKSASDLYGPAKTFSFNAGWGKRVLSIQLTVSNSGTWIFSYGGPLPYAPVTGGGYGINFSYYNTKTRSTK